MACGWCVQGPEKVSVLVMLDSGLARWRIMTHHDVILVSRLLHLQSIGMLPRLVQFVRKNEKGAKPSLGKIIDPSLFLFLRSTTTITYNQSLWCVLGVCIRAYTLCLGARVGNDVIELQKVFKPNNTNVRTMKEFLRQVWTWSPSFFSAIDHNFSTPRILWLPRA